MQPREELNSSHPLPKPAFLKVIFSPDAQQSIKCTDSSTPSPAESEGLGARPGTPRLNKPLARELLRQITGQLPGSPSLLQAWDHQGQQEASPISTFNWACFSVTHLPDFLQQTTLKSWVPPSSRGDILIGGKQEVTRWVPH